jgi:hypothetical protein
MWRIRLLIGGLTLALLGYGGVEILEYFKFPRVQVVPYAQFVQKRPQEGWFRITGGRADVMNTMQTTGRTSHDKQFYVPWISSRVPSNMSASNAVDASLPAEPCFLIVSTTNTKLMEVSGIVTRVATSGQGTNYANASAVEFPTQDVEGMLVTGLHSDNKMRKKIAATANVAEDYVILEEGRKPSFLKGLGIIGVGLILLVAQILYYRSDWHDA